MLIASVFVTIQIHTQSLQLWSCKNGRIVHEYPVSTAANGVGEVEGSESTPRGLHRVARKIGHDAPVNTVFVGRRPTGEMFTPRLYEQHPERDWILTRIMRLEGLIEGFNRGRDESGRCRDSWRRYIYIHGTHDLTNMRVPGSRGCIRMRNEDIACLFEKVEEGVEVLITETGAML